MQHDNGSRLAVLPTSANRAHYRTMRNVDLMGQCGLTQKEIEHVEQVSNAAGEDSLVTLCRLRGVSNIDELMEG